MRKRPILTCNRCREKRIKCDKQSPCASCIKNNCVDECVVAENGNVLLERDGRALCVFRVSKNPNMKTKLNVLKLSTKIPGHVTPHRHTINFYDYQANGNEEATPSYPMEWRFIEMKEPALRFLQQARKLETTKEQETLSQEFDEFNLVSNIERSLPSLESIFETVADFMEQLYFFIPLLDYLSFNLELRRILYEDAHGTHLLLQKEDDLAFIGIFLIMQFFVAFARYMRQLSSKLDCSPSSIILAKQCLRRYMDKGAHYFVVLQLGLMIHFYQKVVPLNFDKETGSGKVFTSTLVQMAYALKIHEKQPGLVKRDYNLKSKTWYLVTVLDTMEATLLGAPIMVDRRTYTKWLLPVAEITTETSNTPNVDLEMAIISFFTALNPLSATLRDLNELITNMAGFTQLSTIAEHVELLESLMETNLGTLKGKVTALPKEASLIQIHHKALSVKTLLSCGVFLLALYAHLRIHFEQNNDPRTAFFYEKKIHQLTIVEMLPIVASLVNDHQKYFGPLGALVTTRFFITMLERSSTLCLATLARLKFHLYNFSTIYALFDDERFEMLQRLITKSELCCDIYSTCLKKFPRLFGTNSTADHIQDCLNFMKSRDNFDSTSFNKVWSIPYTKDQLQELLDLYEIGMEEISILSDQTSAQKLPIDLLSISSDPSVNIDSVNEDWLFQESVHVGLPDAFFGI